MSLRSATVIRSNSPSTLLTWLGSWKNVHPSASRSARPLKPPVVWSPSTNAKRSAARNWRAQNKIVAVLGPLGAQAEGIPERVQGVTEGLKRQLPSTRVVMLDTQGNPGQVGALLGKLLSAQPTAKILIAATDDQTALAAKAALESAGRLQDGAIVSHGVDRSIHGGINEKKELDPNNRGSIVIGSVAFYLDRAGYDVLPLVLGMLQGQTLPPRTTVGHRLVTAANVFTEYPPYDMN